MATYTKTVNPQLVEVSFTNDLTLLQKYSTYLDLVSSFTTELSAYFQYDRALYSSDFVTDLQSFYGDLNSKYKDFDNEFLIYYIKKYNALADQVKAAVLPPSSNSNSYLSELSDSIGILTNTEYMLSDFVEPISDINVTLYPAPAVYPANLRNKIRTASNDIATDLSTQTTTMFRNNIVNIQFTAANSTEAHGSNLVTDFSSYIRARQGALSVTQQLSQSFGQLFKLVTYYSNIYDYSGYNPGDLEMNLQVITDATYLLDVEGALEELDILGKRIVAARKDATMREALVVLSQSQIHPLSQPPPRIVPAPKSTKPVPINSTAPTSKAVVASATNPNATTTTTAPANGKVPLPVGYSIEDRQKMSSSIAAANAKISKAPNTGMLKSPSPITLKIPNVLPEFPRTPFAFSAASPYAIFKDAKNVLCTLKNLDVSALLNIHIPKMPNIFLKIHLPNFKNPLPGLILKAEKFALSKLTFHLPSLPDINKFTANLKLQLKNSLNKIFLCNPGNKN